MYNDSVVSNTSLGIKRTARCVIYIQHEVLSVNRLSYHTYVYNLFIF